MVIQQHLYQYALLMRWHRPIGSFLLLWPTLWALWIAADGLPSTKILAIFVVGVFVMRSAGCVINDYADRYIDGHVERTKNRPLATGQVSKAQALGLFVTLCVVALLLVLQLNWLTIQLAFVGVLLTMVYPFTKRFTHLPQVILGAAFAWSVPMAFAAQANSIPPIAILVYLIALLLPMIYDTEYAMVDRLDDLKIGVRSTAILFGHFDRLMIGILQIIVILLCGLLGYFLSLGIIYYSSIFIAAGLFIYQQYLIKYRDPARCFQAFLNNNWVGLVIWLGLVFA